MKKHMGKKALAFLMAVLMLAAAGCSQGGETSSVGGSTEGDSSEQGSEKVTFTIAVGLNPLSKDEDFNNKEIFKLAEKDTNVHIEWMPIAAADATDKVNIMLTSDLPIRLPATWIPSLTWQRTICSRRMRPTLWRITSPA